MRGSEQLLQLGLQARELGFLLVELCARERADLGIGVVEEGTAVLDLGLDGLVAPVGLHPIAQAAELSIQLRIALRIGSHIWPPQLLLELLVAGQDPLNLFKHTR